MSDLSPFPELNPLFAYKDNYFTLNRHPVRLLAFPSRPIVPTLPLGYPFMNNAG